MNSFLLYCFQYLLKNIDKVDSKLQTRLKIILNLFMEEIEGDEFFHKMALEQLMELKKEFPDQKEINFILGALYEFGFVVEHDLKRAIEYYELAAKQNYSPALTALSINYAKGTRVTPEDQKKATEYLLAAVDVDAIQVDKTKSVKPIFPIAAYHMAIGLLQGYWYKPEWQIQSHQIPGATSSSSSSSQSALVGLIKRGAKAVFRYLNGLIFIKESLYEKEAMELLQYAADQAYGPALITLGWIYRNPRAPRYLPSVRIKSVKKDLKLAYETIEKVIEKDKLEERRDLDDALGLFNFYAADLNNFDINKEKPDLDSVFGLHNFDRNLDTTGYYSQNTFLYLKLQRLFNVMHRISKGKSGPNAVLDDLYIELRDKYTKSIRNVCAISDPKKKLEELDMIAKKDMDIASYMGFLLRKGEVQTTMPKTTKGGNPEEFCLRAPINETLSVQYWKQAALLGSGAAQAYLALISEYGSDHPLECDSEARNFIYINRDEDTVNSTDLERDWETRAIRNEIRLAADAKRVAELKKEVSIRTGLFQHEQSFMKALRYAQFVNHYHNSMFIGLSEYGAFQVNLAYPRRVPAALYYPEKIKMLSNVLKNKYLIENAFAEINVDFPDPIINLIAEYGPFAVKTKIRSLTSLDDLRYENDYLERRERLRIERPKKQ